MLTDVDLGVTGAKRASWDKTNPRELLLRIMAEQPEATEEQLFKLFYAAALKGHYDETVYRYWFTNNYNALRPREAEPFSRPERAAKAKAASEERASVAVKRVAEALLAGIILPNGKAVRDCTFAYVRMQGDRFAKLGRMGKPDKIVGAVLTDEQIEAAR